MVHHADPLIAAETRGEGESLEHPAYSSVAARTQPAAFAADQSAAKQEMKGRFFNFLLPPA